MDMLNEVFFSNILNKYAFMNLIKWKENENFIRQKFIRGEKTL